MNLLSRIVRALRRDPLAELRREPTMDEWLAERARWQDEDVMDALRDGGQSLSGFSNCAYGTRGYSLHVLVDRGLMVCDRTHGLPDSGGRFDYRLTEAGRRARNDLIDA